MYSKALPGLNMYSTVFCFTANHSDLNMTEFVIFHFAKVVSKKRPVVLC